VNDHDQPHPPAPPALHPALIAERQRAIILKVVRAGFLILIVTFTTLAFLQHQGAPEAAGVAQQWWTPIIISILLFAVALAVDVFTPDKKISTIVGVLLGVMAGLIATLALGFIIDLAVEGWAGSQDAVNAMKPTINSIKILIGITLSYLGVTTVLQTQDDFRLVIPYVEFAKQLRGTRPMLLDTSVLIDGRITDIAATGFLQAPLLIPKFVVAELQALADSSDGMKRAKGRRGLEVITKLQRQPRLDVTIDETRVPGLAVDQMLVELGRILPAIIVTTDLGLARVAAIQTVGVLNLNDLANAMKSTLVPGEQLNIKLMRPGEQAGQAVGYLPDGTMVVAEDGSDHIGETVALAVTSSLQTSAGRLIFARVVASSSAGNHGTDGTHRTDASHASQDQAEPHHSDHQHGGTTPTASAEHASDAAGDPTPTPGAPTDDTPRVRSPFPPNKPRSMKTGSPRNPRR